MYGQSRRAGDDALAVLRLLHASAVALGDSAIGFLAPSFFGKSTLACALSDAALDSSRTTRSLSALEGASNAPREFRPFGFGADQRRPCEGLERRFLTSRKHGVFWSDAPWNRRHPTGRLSALYVLHPTAGANGVLASRKSSRYRAEQYHWSGSRKWVALLRGQLAVDPVDRSIQMVARVPVYSLSYVRDLDRLGELAASVMASHASERAAAYCGRNGSPFRGDDIVRGDDTNGPYLLLLC